MKCLMNLPILDGMGILLPGVLMYDEELMET
jgi:hypothetical protein